MISLCLSAFSSANLLCLCGNSLTPLSCIQPEVVVVHRAEGLVEIANLAPGSVIERQGVTEPIRPLDGRRSVRLDLGAGELFRVRSPGGDPPRWMDPLTLEAEPEAAQTPVWTLGAVWYNVFPERFDNAQPANDQGWPHGTPVPWQSDWFEVTPDEFEASANRSIALPQRYRDSSERARSAIMETVFERRYGGDLQGVVYRLDHIKKLGASAIWLCPIFDAVSLHKYDATDHRHIDPHLAWPGSPDEQPPEFTPEADQWAWTPADHYFVEAFLPATKDRDLHVILDGVWNHVGTAHPAFRDARDRSNASPYFDWFDLRTDDSGNVIGWRAWDRRNGDLPAFRQVDGDLAPGPKAYVEDVTRRWMDPNGDGDPADGISGWRLDVANEVGMAFWESWRALVRQINPEAVLFGELWFDGSDYFGGRAFDAQMNYPLAFVLLPWLAGESNPHLADELRAVFHHHPATVLAQMNLLASHDTARLVSVLANPGLEYDQGAGMGAQGFDRSQPSEEVYERLELAYAVLAVLPGSPMVFAGDELGVWGGDDPENRKPLHWPDRIQDELLRELSEQTTSRIGAWLRWRQDEAIGRLLRFGGWRLESESGVLMIERDLNGAYVRLYANASDEAATSPAGVLPPRSAKLVKLGPTGEWEMIHASSEKRARP